MYVTIEAPIIETYKPLTTYCTTLHIKTFLQSYANPSHPGKI